MSKIVESSLELIGGTPLLKLNRYSAQAGVEGAAILAKLEYLNPPEASRIVSHLR